MGADLFELSKIFRPPRRTKCEFLEVPFNIIQAIPERKDFQAFGFIYT